MPGAGGGYRMGRQPSAAAAQHSFARVPTVAIERSGMRRDFSYKTTFDEGLLIPFLVDPIYPGDTFNVRMNGFCRLATPMKPIMDNLYLDTFFFFVPYRLVWSNFVKFMGEQVNPGDSTSYLVPTISVPFTPQLGETLDYMGLPINAAIQYQSPLKISSLPLRSYLLIYNQWFRDENLVNSATVPLTDGPDSYNANLKDLRRRGKRHDYFTSCLPFLQKGTAVTLPLGTTAPVDPAPTGTPLFKNAGGTVLSGILEATTAADPSAVRVNAASGTWGAGEQLYWQATGLVANLATATASTVNDLRTAFQLQKLYERDARGGTRYTEIVRTHFRVVSPDARLQRAEYLGGGSSPIFVTPVAQTSPQQTGTPTPPLQNTVQGNLSGVGTASFQGHGFVKSFTEHGLLIGILSVRADMTYQQGIERFWTDQTKNDFYWPTFAHLGEQAVLNKEIWLTGNGNAVDDQVFGYQERYGHLRYKPGRITGKFRSDMATGSLDLWHLAQDFATLPTLNQTFIEESPPVSRVLAVPTEPHFLLDAYVQMKCARPLPLYGVPGFIDHF